VADDDGFSELVSAYVIGQAIANAVEHWSRDARDSRESCHCQNVAFEAALVVSRSGVPSLAAGRKTWNQNHRLTFTNDVHLERVLGQKTAGECEEEQYGFHENMMPGRFGNPAEIVMSG